MGVERKRYRLYKNLLCEDSLFFRACLENQNFQEGVNAEAHLLDDTCDAFEVIVQWLYDKEYFNKKVNHDSDEWIRAWILADRLCMG